MSARPFSRQAQVRSHIAKEAARLMIEGGIADYQLAKRKAAERLRLDDPARLPRNDEIDEAMQEYQRLFRADPQLGRLLKLRRLAVDAMAFLERFRPRLVGSVLAGTADDVAFFLMEHGLDFETGERRMRVTGDEVCRVPTFEFIAEEAPVEIMVFSGRIRQRSPLSPVDGKPMDRAGIGRVRALDAARTTP